MKRHREGTKPVVVPFPDDISIVRELSLKVNRVINNMILLHYTRLQKSKTVFKKRFLIEKIRWVI